MALEFVLKRMEAEGYGKLKAHKRSIALRQICTGEVVDRFYRDSPRRYLVRQALVPLVGLHHLAVERKMLYSLTISSGVQRWIRNPTTQIVRLASDAAPCDF